MGRKHDSTKTDFSSFMCVILMLTGALVTIMIANIVIISANPDNIRISSIMGMTEFSDGNEAKQPNYVDVHRDRMDLYFDKDSGKIAKIAKLLARAYNNLADMESGDTGYFSRYRTQEANEWRRMLENAADY